VLVQIREPHIAPAANFPSVVFGVDTVSIVDMVAEQRLAVCAYKAARKLADGHGAHLLNFVSRELSPQVLRAAAAPLAKAPPLAVLTDFVAVRSHPRRNIFAL
jgi:hypothetical protein